MQRESPVGCQVRSAVCQHHKILLGDPQDGSGGMETTCGHKSEASGAQSACALRERAVLHCLISLSEDAVGMC